MLSRIKRVLRFIFYKVIRIRGTPEEISRGLALGIFVGMTPTMGFQMAIGAFIAALLKQNIIATALAVWITNPFTFIPIYSFNYQVGKFILNSPGHRNISEKTFSSMKTLIGRGWDFFYTLWFGSIVVGIVLSVIIYYLCVPAIKKYKEKLRLLRKKGKEKKAQKLLAKDEASKQL